MSLVLVLFPVVWFQKRTSTRFSESWSTLPATHELRGKDVTKDHIHTHIPQPFLCWHQSRKTKGTWFRRRRLNQIIWLPFRKGVSGEKVSSDNNSGCIKRGDVSCDVNITRCDTRETKGRVNHIISYYDQLLCHAATWFMCHRVSSHTSKVSE